MKRKVFPIIVIIIIVVLAGGMALKGKSAPAYNTKVKASTPKTTNKVTVVVKKAEITELTSNMQFKATLVASKEGIVSSEVSGKVVKVLFENGQYIKQGAPLVALDDNVVRNNIESSKAQLEVARNMVALKQAALGTRQLNVDSAKIDYDRTKFNFDLGDVSKIELDNIETAYKIAKNDFTTAKIEIESAKANIRADQASLKTLETSLRNMVITAPISGFASDRNVSVGQYVNPGAVFGKIMRAAPIYAVIEVGQDDLGYIKVGDKAAVKIGNDESSKFQGVIKTIDSSANESTRVFKCKIELENKDQSIKPGTFAKVELAKGRSKKAISLPLEALSGSEGSYYVFVNENGVARKRNVTIGEISKNSVEILSGVDVGNDLICSNVNILQDGDAVSPASK